MGELRLLLRRRDLGVTWMLRVLSSYLCSSILLVRTAMITTNHPLFYFHSIIATLHPRVLISPFIGPNQPGYSRVCT